MSGKRFTSNGQWIAEGTIVDICDNGKVIMQVFDNDNIQNVVDLLNEQEQKIQRWKNLYELKDAEVTARVDALNKVCEYYTSEVLFKSDVDPNKAVKEVINEILNAPIYEEG